MGKLTRASRTIMIVSIVNAYLIAKANFGFIVLLMEIMYIYYRDVEYFWMLFQGDLLSWISFDGKDIVHAVYCR